MRRLLFTALGVLEVLAACVLFAFAWQLPGPGEVDEAVGRVERVSTGAGKGVDRLRTQLQQLRQDRPRLRILTDQVSSHLATLSEQLDSRPLDYDAVQTVARSLGDVARGLDLWATTFDPATAKGLGAGLGHAADYLEDK